MDAQKWTAKSTLTKKENDLSTETGKAMERIAMRNQGISEDDIEKKLGKPPHIPASTLKRENGSLYVKAERHAQIQKIKRTGRKGIFYRSAGRR